MSSKKVCASCSVEKKQKSKKKILWSKSAVNEQQLDGLWKNSFIRNLQSVPFHLKFTSFLKKQLLGNLMLPLYHGGKNNSQGAKNYYCKNALF
jgi:hypothetical protein